MSSKTYIYPKEHNQPHILYLITFIQSCYALLLRDITNLEKTLEVQLCLRCVLCAVFVCVFACLQILHFKSTLRSLCTAKSPHRQSTSLQERSLLSEWSKPPCRVKQSHPTCLHVCPHTIPTITSWWKYSSRTLKD